MLHYCDWRDGGRGGAMMAAMMVTVMMVEKEGVSVREPSNAANEFGQAVGEVGTRLPGRIQDV